MAKRNLLYLIVALMVIFWGSQSVQSQSETELKKKTCGDLLLVEQHNKWGYINKTGQIVIPLQYQLAKPFSEGLAPVMVGGKWGYVEATGQMAIQPQFDNAEEFSEGLARVDMEPKGKPDLYNCGYIDRSGRWVIPPKYKSLESAGWTGPFSEGQACVMLHHKYGFVDRTGQEVVPL
jgi:hypothetical protein